MNSILDLLILQNTNKGDWSGLGNSGLKEGKGSVFSHCPVCQKRTVSLASLLTSCCQPLLRMSVHTDLEKTRKNMSEESVRVCVPFFDIIVLFAICTLVPCAFLTVGLDLLAALVSVRIVTPAVGGRALSLSLCGLLLLDGTDAALPQ